MEYPPVYVFWAMLGGVLVGSRTPDAAPIAARVSRDSRAGVAT